MSEPSEVQALEKISTEVGDSQVKITLSSQCIKAQAFLVDKLRKQSERQKEICSFISCSNLKLQTEIRQAELEIKSLMVAQETIKSSNVELKKECLLIKERKSETEERIQNGEKKYEDLWLQAKARYESIPFVQKLLQAQNRTLTLKEDIKNLENISQCLVKDIKTKERFVANLDRKRVIELAEFMVHELPNGIKTIQDKTKEINEISKEIDEIVKQREKELIKNNITIAPDVEKEMTKNDLEKSKITIDDGWYNFGQNNERESIMMPQIQLLNTDFDVLSAKLDKIKIKKGDMFNIPPTKRVDTNEPETEIDSKKRKKDDDFSMFFTKPISEEVKGDFDGKEESYSKRKLINILEDIKLDKNDAFDALSKINPDTLKGVDKIGADTSDGKRPSYAGKEQANEVIEEIDLTKSSEKILIPPTQFLDFAEGNFFSGTQQQVIVHMSMPESPSGKANQSLREYANKKRVSFDLPMSIQEINDNNEVVDDAKIIAQESDLNETTESKIDISLVSDESYTKMKDMILKKHNLDLSPQFIYAKNSTFGMNNDDKIITSKFFQSGKVDVLDKNEDSAKVTEIAQAEYEQEPTLTTKTNQNPNDMEVDEVVVVSSPKENTAQKSDRPVTGLLFQHGAQGIPDSLNVSISTTGFEEGDGDFPHCIDSSLLLSPKPDFQIPMSGDNAEITSQEVPNFLSGLRKTGFSFFGQPSSDSKPDTSGQNENNFNFNFGGEEKKGRGGLFSMFR